MVPEREPCGVCGEPVALAATICGHCQASALVDVVLTAPVSDGRKRYQVARALLVAPPQPDDEDAQSIGFRPTPLDRDGVAAAARETRLACSTNDPWCPPEISRRIGEETGVTIDWLEHAGHINTDAGYGPWPAVEAWALGEQTGVV